MTRQEIIRELLQEYRAERTENERARDRREEEAEKRDPVLADIRAESASVVARAVRSIAGADREAAMRAAQEMKERGAQLVRQREERLAMMGYPGDWLKVRYNCPVCLDTGYTSDFPQKFCECFEKRLAQKLYEDGSLTGGERQSFETYDENVYPAENGQRRQANAARDYCEKYADRFPKCDKPGLVLMGTGGLGKTYLLNCIYERVVSRGIAAVRVSSYRLNEIMRANHMQQDEGAFDDLLRVPLLLIDDLGTESIFRNVTIEYMFQLINERMSAGLGTVAATNLTPPQLIERYGERVASRLMDRRRVGTLLLTGRDIRFL